MGLKMIEKRFVGSSGGVYDQYKGDRFTWAEWEEILQIMNNLNEKARERSKALSKLQKENMQLKSDKVFAELLANHRGEKINFATLLIQNMGSKKMLQIWNEFEENKLKKYLRTWDWSMEFERQVVTDHYNSQYEMMEKDCCELLNKLFDENEQLKIQLQNTSNQRDEFHCGARENANRVGILEKENEELKSEIKDLNDILARYEEKELQE